eukprot:TRINITY_DN841_c0_g1_i1.p1 TRINITY_DN841_c0_g1~~TRINITY_DN841_c0_g1_i1.p1  ORF type:complete len:300 (-),score=69.42 TRINITY_DN841_c0_g1_i1:28-927(-)
MGKNGVCSNYSYDTVDYTTEAIKNFKRGKAIFTQPNVPVKCGGAPQKIMYLADANFRKYNKRKGNEIHFYSGMPGIFPVPEFAAPLLEHIKSHNLQTHFRHLLTKVDGENRIATFKNLDTEEEVTTDFNLLHVTPHMSAPDFLKKSNLLNAAGFVDVDKYTGKHKKYNNIWSIGDCSGIPVGSKTAAAVIAQTPGAVRSFAEETNLVDIEKLPKTAKYDGYTACPLTMGDGKVLLAEFDYTMRPKETFYPLSQAKPRRSFYLMKKYLFPYLYFESYLNGKWNGPDKFRIPGGAASDHTH